MKEKNAALLAVSLGTPQLQTCSVEINDFTAETVTVTYNGLPGNQPAIYKNYVAIWEATVVPWGVLPIQKTNITQNLQSGTITLTGLTITKNSYIVGYSVGSSDTDICASAVLHAGGLRAAPMNVQMGIAYVGTNSVSVNYQTLAGYLPMKYKNWIGLWKGYAYPYNASEPLGKIAITSDSSEGTTAINNVSMGIDSTYTLIYFVGENTDEAAAILTFNTSAANGN
jgi:hypothetical protein